MKKSFFLWKIEEMDVIKTEKEPSTEERVSSNTCFIFVNLVVLVCFSFGQIVELLNSAATEGDDQTRVDSLIKIQELIIHQEAGLLDNFVDEITAFQHDRSADVRKTIVGFIEEAWYMLNNILILDYCSS